MIDAMMPILRELYEARDEHVVADCLLRMPDAVVLKYQRPIEASCRRAGFARGAEFVALRVSLMQAVRNSAGGLPGGPSMALAQAQVDMGAIALGVSRAAPPPLAAGPATAPSDGLAACTAGAKADARPEALDI